MCAQADPDRPPAEGEPPRLSRMLPCGEPATVAEIVEDMGLWERGEEPAGRPRVMLNMVATADGRSTINGRSAPLSSRADRELFHGLRAPVDAVLVGAGTARTERYGRLIPAESRRRLREQRGLSAEPLACIVSASLALGADLPLLADGDARVVILTPSSKSLAAVPAQLDYVRTQRDGLVDLPAALAELRERFAVRTLLCEGGPHLAAQLFAAGLVDELFLSVSPMLAGGDGAGGESLRILAGEELEPAVELEFLGALRSGSNLFLRYGASARERVSRETIPSSSLAR